MGTKLIFFWLAFTLGNFAYQAMNSKQWAMATERSYFQGFILLAAYWLVIRK